MNIQQAQQNLEALQAKQKEFDTIQNEGGYGYNPYDEKVSQALRALSKAETKERQDWLDENFFELRVEWNTWVRENTDSKGRLDRKAANEKAASMGIKIDELKETKQRLAAKGVEV